VDVRLRKTLISSGYGKQDLEYKIITFKIFRCRKTKPRVYKQNLYKFPCPETVSPHPPGVRAVVSVPAVSGKTALGNGIVTKQTGYGENPEALIFSG